MDQELPFLLFSGYDYSPQGGWTDFVNAYKTLEEAILHTNRLVDMPDSWAHVVDIRTRKIVWESD